MLDCVTHKKSSSPPLCGHSAEGTGLSGPHSDLSPLWGETEFKRRGGKGFFKLNPWRSEVALEGSLASCAHSDLQTPSQGWVTPSGWCCQHCAPKRKLWGGRQAGCRACCARSHAGDALREMGSCGRGNHSEEWHCPGPQNALN